MGDNLKRSIYALRGKTPFEKSLLKATYDGDSDPPKEKHVQTIIWTLQGQNMQTPPEAAFNSICQRLMTSRWATALKSEIILHRGIEQIGPGYASRLADLNIPMQNFNDPSEKGSSHNRIIQDYFVYIRSCAHNSSRRNSSLLVPPADRAKLFSHLESPELIKEVGLLLNQLQHLVKLGPSCHQAIRNYHLKLTQNAAYIILKDASTVYKTISLAVETMLDRFFTMDKTLAEHAFEQYKRFDTCTRMLSQFFEIASYLPYSGLVPPTFVKKPYEVIESMTSYVQENGEITSIQREEVTNDQSINKEEVEHNKTSDEYDKENKKKQYDTYNTELLCESEVIHTQSVKPAQSGNSSSSIDLLLGAFESTPLNNQTVNPNTQPANPNIQPVQNVQQSGMNPMMQAMMSGMMPGGMPGMTGGMPNMMGGMPSMMTGMPNMMGGIPGMMGGMPNMMGGMISPAMMTGMPSMMNPMFQAFMTQQMQARSNLDPNSKPLGQLGDPSNSGLYSNPHNRSTVAQDPFGNPVPQSKASNAFESVSSSNPFNQSGVTQPRSVDMFNQPKAGQSADLFRDLI